MVEEQKQYVLIDLQGRPITAQCTDGPTPEHRFESAIADF